MQADEKLGAAGGLHVKEKPMKNVLQQRPEQEACQEHQGEGFTGHCHPVGCQSKAGYTIN